MSIYKTAGWGRGERMLIEPGIAKCGEINDGVMLEHIEPDRITGCWVLGFADLQDAYFQACAARGLTVEHVGRAYLEHQEAVEP